MTHVGERMSHFYEELGNFVDFQKEIWYDSFYVKKIGGKQPTQNLKSN